MQKLLKPAALALAIAISGAALATAASAGEQPKTWKTDQLNSRQASASTTVASPPNDSQRAGKASDSTSLQPTWKKPSLTQTWLYRHDPE